MLPMLARDVGVASPIPRVGGVRAVAVASVAHPPSGRRAALRQLHTDTPLAIVPKGTAIHCQAVGPIPEGSWRAVGLVEGAGEPIPCLPGPAAIHRRHALGAIVVGVGRTGDVHTIEPIPPLAIGAGDIHALLSPPHPQQSLSALREAFAIEGVPFLPLSTLRDGHALEAPFPVSIGADAFELLSAPHPAVVTSCFRRKAPSIHVDFVVKALALSLQVVPDLPSEAGVGHAESAVPDTDGRALA